MAKGILKKVKDKVTRKPKHSCEWRLLNTRAVADDGTSSEVYQCDSCGKTKVG